MSVHFSIQSVPVYSATKTVKLVKSITAREIFHRCPNVKKRLWGGEFWGKGCFVNTVGQHGAERMTAKHVKEQGLGEEYAQLKTNLSIEIISMPRMLASR